MKKLLSLALTFCMILTLVPAVTPAAAAFVPQSVPAAADIVAWSVTEGFTASHGINMTQETMLLPDGYVVGMYRMLQPGKLKGDWIDATNRPLNNKNLSSLLNRGGALFITTAAFNKKGPSAADVVIQFPHINTRPNHLKYQVNYSFGESKLIDNLGTWTIAEVHERKHRMPTRQLMAIQPASGGKLTTEDLNAGRFRDFVTQDVAATREAARANMWFVRENALAHPNGTFTPSSRIKRFSGRTAGKAPEFKDTAVTKAASEGRLRARKNWLYTLNGEHLPSYTTGDSSTLITRSGTYVFWVAPTPTKPPSLRSKPIAIGTRPS